MSEREIIFTDSTGAGWTAQELNECLDNIRTLAKNLEWLSWYR